MEIKLEELMAIAGGRTVNPFSDKIGKNVFIRTVTHHFTGKVESVTGDFVELSRAAWIADDGRLYDSLKKEEFNEVEPYVNNVFVNTTSIIDFTPISKLSESQK